MKSMTSCEITAQQKRMWIETRSALLWTCPAFTHILFSMMNPQNGELVAFFTKDVPIAATDGENLILNPDRFFTFSLPERIFIVAHEILHAVYNHCGMSRPFRQSGKVKFSDGTELDYDDRTMNIAMDLVINDALIQAKIGSFPKEGVHNQQLATQSDSFLDAYKKVYKQQKKQPPSGNNTQPGNNPGSGGGGGKHQPGQGPGSGFDTVLDPGTAQGKDPGQTQQKRSQAEWDTAVAGAIAAAKAQGKLPASLERLLGAVLEPQVSWQEHIRSFFARKVGGGSYDWRRPDKRLIQRDIFSPRRSGNGCGEVVVAVDTSGSIGQPEITHFIGELRGILEDVRPTKVWLLWCDAQVHKVDEIDSAFDLASLKPCGGGGTDFRPVFDWVTQSDVRPDALVYLTDMLGAFPSQAPSYPVIWGDIYGHCKAPFGEVVNIPLKK